MIATTSVTRSDLQRLFELNRSLPAPDRLEAIEEIEAAWLAPLIAEAAAQAPALTSTRDIARAVEELVAEDATTPNPAADFVANEATWAQFRAVVADYAVDGLTEAQNFFPAIPRLPIKAQMAVMRVLIDEFGCGNLLQAHSQLYMNLLTELGLPLDVGSYLPHVTTGTLAFVDAFYWLASRAPDAEYFLGALAYLEACIPTSFACMADACIRLGIANHHYYTEHMHIDGFHRRELQTAIRELDADRGCDLEKVWVGMTVLRRLFAESFEDAVAAARAVA